MNRKSLERLAVSLAIPQLAGLVGSIFTAPNISAWYSGLEKPWFVPPNWLFAPAWTTLFVLMGLALFIVWEKGGKQSGMACRIFGVQLVLNVLWSILFFGLRSPLLGLAEIIALWAAIAWSIRVFYGIDRRAGYLLVPYIAWVTFAAVLNMWIVLLN